MSVIKKIPRVIKSQIKRKKSRMKKRHEKLNVFFNSLRYSKKTFKDVNKFVLFIGTSRSGHTLVGSLLDSHQNVIIGHELNIVPFFPLLRFKKTRIYSAILTQSKKIAKKRNRTMSSYDYNIEGQGEYKKLEVIGDKKGGATTHFINDNANFIDIITEMYQNELLFINVIRNPYDNIAAMAYRDKKPIDQVIESYFSDIKSTEWIKSKVDSGKIIVLYHESLIEKTEFEFKRLCSFLGIEAADNFLEKCSAKTYKKPHCRRYTVDWSKEQIDRIKLLIEDDFKGIFSFYDLNDYKE